MGPSTSDLAPILVSVYNRPSHLARCIESLKINGQAQNSKLFIVSDGPSRPADEPEVEEVRRIASAVQGFQEVHLIAREQNLGFFKSITQAQDFILDQFGKIIFLEDDIEVSPSFLEFINTALIKYQANPSIYSISGYCPPSACLPPGAPPSVFPGPFFCPWGFGTWRDRQHRISRTRNVYREVLADKPLKMHMMKHCPMMLEVLRRDYFKDLSTIDVRISCQMLLSRMVTIYPSLSLTRNLGFDGSGERMRPNRDMANQALGADFKVASWELIPDESFALKIMEHGTSIDFSELFSLLYRLNLRDAVDPLLDLTRRLVGQFVRRKH